MDRVYLLMCVCMCKNSALSGVRGVSVGDEMTAVDDCQVRSVSEWTECVSELLRRDQRGYCLTLDLLHQLDISLKQQRTSPSLFLV